MSAHSAVSEPMCDAHMQTEEEEKQVAATEKADAEMVTGKKLMAESKTTEEAKSLLKGFKKVRCPTVTTY